MQRIRFFAAIIAALLLLSALPAGALTRDEDPILVEMENDMIAGKPADDGAWIVKERYNDLKALSEEGRAFVKGQETRYDPVALDGADALTLDSKYCGLILRPASGDRLEIAYWGEAPEAFVCESKRGEHGEMTLRIEGPDADKLYVNMHDERLYNVFVLGIPAGIRALDLEEDVGVCHLSGLDLGAVKAENEGGSIDVRAEALTGRYEVDCDQGSVRLTAGKISGVLDMETEQGFLTVKAGELTGEAELSAQQGWVTVKGGRIAGAKLSAEQGWVTVEAENLADSRLTAEQGWVTVDADSLADSRLTAEQGWVTVEAVTLNGAELRAPQGWVDLTADSIAGPVQAEGEWCELRLKKAPTDLRLDVRGRSAEREGKGFAPPKGFARLGEGSYAIGNGSPVLEVTGNWIEIDIPD